MANLGKQSLKAAEHEVEDSHKPHLAPPAPVQARKLTNQNAVPIGNPQPAQNLSAAQGIPMAGPKLIRPDKFSAALALYYQVHYWQPKADEKSRLNLDQRLQLKNDIGDQLILQSRIQFQEGLEKEVEDAEAATNFHFDPTSATAPSMEQLLRDIEALAREPSLPPSVGAAIEKFQEEFGRCATPEPTLRASQAPEEASLHRPEPHNHSAQPAIGAGPDD